MTTARFRGNGSVNTSPRGAHQKSNFSKNVNGPGTNRTTLVRSVTIPLRSTHIKLSYRQKNKVPMSSARFPWDGLTGSCLIGSRTEIQFFQKCKWSWNEQKNIGEVGDDSFTVHRHRTHIESEKKIQMGSARFCYVPLDSGGIGKTGSCFIGSRTPNRHPTLGKSVTIHLRSTHLRLKYRQKNIVPVGSVMFG
jgi:hypothetical protein